MLAQVWHKSGVYRLCSSGNIFQSHLSDHFWKKTKKQMYLESYTNTRLNCTWVLLITCGFKRYQYHNLCSNDTAKRQNITTFSLTNSITWSMSSNLNNIQCHQHGLATPASYLLWLSHCHPTIHVSSLRWCVAPIVDDFVIAPLWKCISGGRH